VASLPILAFTHGKDSNSDRNDACFSQYVENPHRYNAREPFPFTTNRNHLSLSFVSITHETLGWRQASIKSSSGFLVLLYAGFELFRDIQESYLAEIFFMRKNWWIQEALW